MLYVSDPVQHFASVGALRASFSGGLGGAFAVVEDSQGILLSVALLGTWPDGMPPSGVSRGRQEAPRGWGRPRARRQVPAHPGEALGTSAHWLGRTNSQGEEGGWESGQLVALPGDVRVSLPPWLWAVRGSGWAAPPAQPCPWPQELSVPWGLSLLPGLWLPVRLLPPVPRTRASLPGKLLIWLRGQECFLPAKLQVRGSQKADFEVSCCPSRWQWAGQREGRDRSLCLAPVA